MKRVSPVARRAARALLLLAVLVNLCGCSFLKSRDWPKFWKKKPPTNIFIDEGLIPLYDSDSFPPPIDLGSSSSTGSPAQPPVSISEVDPVRSDDVVVVSELPVIYFPYNSFALSDGMRVRIQGAAQWINARAQGRQIIIEGHCDERGTAEYNMSLGHDRAATVRAALYELGVDPAMLSTVSYGEERPADPGNDETAFQKNRRVQFLAH
jgi:peptidoglycan-associated lipoprotein